MLKNLMRCVLAGALLLLLLLLLLPQRARADLAEGVGVWRGHGAIYSPMGKTMATYEVEAVKVMLASGALETRITQTMTDGSVVRSTQTQTLEPEGVTHVEGEGLAFDVFPLGDKTAQAVIDTPDGQRVVVTIVRHREVITVVKTVMQGSTVTAFAKERLTRD